MTMTNGRYLVIFVIVCAISIPLSDGAAVNTTNDTEAEEGSDCGVGYFKCGNGICLEEAQVCDGISDCEDAKVSDENNSTCPGLPIKCPPKKQRCPNTNACYHPADLCDGYNDCGDNADEEPSFCKGLPCPSLSVVCPSGRCIPETWLCDGSNDCGDDWDEGSQCAKNGSFCLGSYVFQCDNAECVSRALVCDGEEDCSDGSDEKEDLNCGNRICSDDEFSCNSTEAAQYECIPKAWLCDGVVHCQNGGDESTDVCKEGPESCSDLEFRCQNGACIPEQWICDFEPDCRDGSDEPASCNSTITN